MFTQKRFLFKFRIPCSYVDFGGELDESYKLPDLSLLELSVDSLYSSCLKIPETGHINTTSRSGYSTAKPIVNTDFGVRSGVLPDFRVGWNERGIAIVVKVNGKKQSLWCKSTSPNESDGVQICLDTRDVKDVHRATRFCHRLVFLPTINDNNQPEPCAFWLPIHRAKAHPNPIDVKKIKLTNKISKDGYELKIFMPQDVLTGFDPTEYSAMGFHFVVVDRELGNGYFIVEPPFPFDQDPSLWGTLALVRR
ncbi:MAG: hypothetical protein LBJ00_03425 [Planctomycetaceae bacterium]|jgi:hypothetical protein|nr:hypothetical protein [Planctomycetaceae bacterium]